jgi:signal transduction histidine kinase
MAPLRNRRDDGFVDDQPQSQQNHAQGQPDRPEASRGTDWQSSPRSAWAPHRHGAWVRGGGPLRRQVQGRYVGGVAAGISARTGFGANIIRAVFVFSSLAGGFGAMVYVLAWLFLPAVDEDGSIASRAQSDRRGIALAAAAASLLAVILIWRNASQEEQAFMRRLAEPIFGETPGAPEVSSRRISRFRKVRVVIAALLLITGVSILVSEQFKPALLRPLTGVLATIAAIVLLLGPWWLRVARDNLADRQARIRAEERAEMASRVHDSVLQTLALIQRRAHDPNQVVSLARAQERELRSWLFDGRAPGSLDGLATTLADGVRLIQQEVEAQHGIVVEAIGVGDCSLDDDLTALLAAAREATVNAAKWSGAGTVSLFAEVEPAAVSVFVRDRGRGFDPAAVPEDRKGLAESVRARVERRGGSATVRSTPGEGTEVVLTMPRTAQHREPSPAT